MCPLVSLHQFLDADSERTGEAQGDSSKFFGIMVARDGVEPPTPAFSVAFIGYLVGGPLGAALAALAMFAPPYMIVLFGAPYYRRFAQNRQVKAFVQGVTAAAVGAIAGAAFILARRSIVDLPTALIGGATLVVLLRTKKIPEPLLILAAGGAGILLHSFKH
jgi:chromate transporter